MEDLLAAQCLDRRYAGPALKVIRRLVALQAQLPSTPAMTLAARIERVPDLEKLTNVQKTLLKVWCLRGTLHLVHSGDLPLLYGAVMRDWADVMEKIMKRVDGLSAREIRANERAMLRKLEEGPMTRNDLPNARAFHWGRGLRILGYKGLLIHAGRRGAEVVFDLRERWAPKSDLGKIPVREARVELLKRYLAAYGPSSPRDFSYWTGMGVGDAARVFKDAGVKPGVPRATRGPPRLLPRFDVFLLGHRDHSLYLDKRHYKKVFKPAAQIEPVFLVDGRIQGTWSYDRMKLLPFAKIDAGVRKALEAEAEILRPFLG
ncbi:MAG: AlkZ family DNA glycosylase [Planctomycetes bacterium]|nr:AlkZ family DNA glycosylase [Planctomycetota bacterium]